MKRFSKKYKVIALVNSYHSLEGSDHTYDQNIQKSMQWCVSEIEKLGYNLWDLPMTTIELIKHLDNE